MAISNARYFKHVELNMTGGKPPNDVVLILRIPRDLREAVAERAYRKNISLSEAARQAMQAWLDREQEAGR